MTLKAAILTVVCLQALTFFVLVPMMWADSNWRLALAQFGLGVITLLVYAP